VAPTARCVGVDGGVPADRPYGVDLIRVARPVGAAADAGLADAGCEVQRGERVTRQRVTQEYPGSPTIVADQNERHMLHDLDSAARTPDVAGPVHVHSAIQSTEVIRRSCTAGRWTRQTSTADLGVVAVGMRQNLWYDSSARLRNRWYADSELSGAGYWGPDGDGW